MVSHAAAICSSTVVLSWRSTHDCRHPPCSVGGANHGSVPSVHIGACGGPRSPNDSSVLTSSDDNVVVSTSAPSSKVPFSSRSQQHNLSGRGAAYQHGDPSTRLRTRIVSESTCCSQQHFKSLPHHRFPGRRFQILLRGKHH